MKTSYKIALAAAVGLFLIVVAYVSVPGGAPAGTNGDSGDSTVQSADSGTGAPDGDDSTATDEDELAGGDGSVPSPPYGSEAQSSTTADESGTGDVGGSGETGGSLASDVRSLDSQAGQGDSQSTATSTGRAEPETTSTGGDTGTGAFGGPSASGSDTSASAGPGNQSTADAAGGPVGNDLDGNTTAGGDNNEPAISGDPYDTGDNTQASASGTSGTGSPSTAGGGLGTDAATSRGEDTAGANIAGSTQGDGLNDRGTGDQQSVTDTGATGTTASSGLSSTSPGASPDGSERGDVPSTYTVQQGDTMWTIAAKFYDKGKHWRAIAEANGMTDPARLKPGDEIELPPESAVGSDGGGVETTQAQPEGNYTVQPGETLSTIAAKHYGDPSEWRRIYEQNKDRIEQPDELQAGMRLKVPASSDEQSDDV